MPSSSTNLSGVAALAPHLYLWTLVSSDHHVLLQHFLRHYSSLGVLLATHAHIVIHRRDNGTESDHGVRRVHAVLADFGGVGNVSEYVEPNVKALEGGKLAASTPSCDRCHRRRGSSTPTPTSSSATRATSFRASAGRERRART